MKILFDECVPKRFGSLFPQHQNETVPAAGFAGYKNGKLLTAASEAGFEVFVTVDRNLSYQQNVATLAIPIVVLHTRSNRLSDLQALTTALAALLASPLERKVYHVRG